jgi:predicted Zn-dependent protease
MKTITTGTMILLAATAYRVAAVETNLPPFLPAYYAPAFSSDGKALGMIGQSETNGVTQYIYSTKDENLALSIENIVCDKPRCGAIFNNLLGYLNQLVTSNEGSFVEITETEAHAEVILTNAAQTIFTFILPSSVHIWTASASPTNRVQLGADFRAIRGWANRQRYEEALQAGNVSMGHWQKCIYDYAKDLLESGKTDEALIVLKNLLATAPFDYEAHLKFIENAPNSASATNSAKTVFKNAEDQDQIVTAAHFIGIEPRTIDAFPPLATNEAGLQVILIPLPPCNPWLLDEAAKVFERITEVPVKIRRLNEAWSWGTPERISRQRDIQGILVRLARENIDFTEWSKDRYIDALTDAVKLEDALSKYWVRDLAEQVKKESGQYFVDPYLDRLCSTLKSYRSKDNRTMYVAITEANIYSGDNNYVFSLGRTDQESPASIMSYYMMLGRTIHETYDSRQRLVERIAKELVPASLKQLGIPRSTDPTCPYSYSSGVDRLDQKTLMLSDDVKEALNKLRDPTTGSSVP